MSNKKKSLFFSSGGSVELGIPLIMEVNTEDLSSADSPSDSIILPFFEGNTVNLQIDWGDGTALEPYTDTNLICTHQYALGGFYDIKIYNLDGVSRIPWNIGFISSIRRDNSKFYDLKQFGDCEIYQLAGGNPDTRTFFACRNLDITATDISERCIELIASGTSMFRDCAIVEAIDSANWDTSNNVSFSTFFQDNTNIIVDCSNWEMSQVETIANIFSGCGNLNPDVTNWDISINCTSLLASFANLSNFERNLSNWDVSGVLTMQNTFLSCTSFTGQGLDTWVTSALTNLQTTFFNCTNFNGNLQNFDVSGVTTMRSAFLNCSTFQGNGLDNWVTTSQLSTIQSAFQSCTNFNGNLQNFDVSGVTTMQGTFLNCINFEGQGLQNWTTTSLTNMLSTFNEARNFNADLGGWNVSGVNTLDRTFLGAISFEGQGLSIWSTTSLTNLNQCFDTAIVFNQDLSGWDFSNVTSMTNWGEAWGMDTNNYDKLLLSFASQTLQPNLTNVRMDSKYTAGEVTNGVTDGANTNKLIDSTQNFTSTVNVGDVIFNTTQDIYAEVVTVDSNTELTLDLDIMALGDTYSVEGSNVAKARYFVVKTYNWQIIDDGQA